MSRTLLFRLHDLLDRSGLRGPRLAEALEQVGREHGVEPFQACLELVSARRRSATEARDALSDIEAHRGDLEFRLGRDPGFLVAAVDHLRDAEGAGWGRIPAAVPADTRLAHAEAPFEDRLDAELRRSARTGRPLVLALLAPRDPLADAAVAAAAAALERARRDVDVLARLVPPAFALLLPSVDRAGGERAVERMLGVAARSSGAEWCAGLAGWSAGAEAGLEALAGAALRALRLARDGERGGRALAAERRRHRRAVKPALEARIDGSKDPAELLDLSISGARLRTDGSLPADREIALRLRGPAPRAREARLSGRVIRTDPAHETAVLLFDDKEGVDPDLAALLAGLPTSAREGRA